MKTATSNVGAVDRLSFTIFLALALHALLIFGISFTVKQNQSRSPTLDVTLSLHDSIDDTANEDADFLSDSNQLGSGTLEDKALLKSSEQAEIEDNKIFHTTPTIQQIQFSELSQSNNRIISTTSKSETNAQKETLEDGSTPKPESNDESVQLENITDVATLKALLEESRQSYARRPRVKTLTALSTQKASDAKYIYQWLEKVERIGNQNYPESARIDRLSGSVRLAVSINADGSIRSVKVSHSSGHAVLDQAAKRIVYLSAPFDTFSSEMTEQYDVLEIIRTWQFKVNNQFGVQSDG